MLIFDLETDGFLAKCSKVHCLSIYDTEDDTIVTYNDEGDKDPIVRGIKRLLESDCICGHIILGFDIPVIKKLYPFFEEAPYSIDTRLLSRL